MEPAEIAKRLRPVLLARNLKLANKSRLLHALEIYSSHPFLDFEDALAVAQTEDEGISTITSFDIGFDRVPDVQRVEPGGVDQLEAA
jgi:predicted nucleic acid-binding protein